MSTVLTNTVVAGTVVQACRSIAPGQQSDKTASASNAPPATRDLGGPLGDLRRLDFPAHLLTKDQGISSAIQDHVDGCGDTISGSCPVC